VFEQGREEGKETKKTSKTQEIKSLASLILNNFKSEK